MMVNTHFSPNAQYFASTITMLPRLSLTFHYYFLLPTFTFLPRLSINNRNAPWVFLQFSLLLFIVHFHFPTNAQYLASTIAMLPGFTFGALLSYSAMALPQVGIISMIIIIFALFI